MRLVAVFVICFFTIKPAAGQIGHFVNQTEVGLLTGNSGDPNLSVRSFNGIRFKSVPLETGLTLGVDDYSRFTITPVTISCLWNPLQTKVVSPYLSLDMGYGFDWLQRKNDGLRYSGGSLVVPSAGIRVKTASALKLVLNISYKQQEASISSDLPFSGPSDFQAYETSEYVFKRLYLSFGLNF